MGVLNFDKLFPMCINVLVGDRTLSFFPQFLFPLKQKSNLFFKEKSFYWSKMFQELWMDRSILVFRFRVPFSDEVI